MKLLRMALLVLLAAGLGRPLSSGEKADPSWERLKSLVGEWQGAYEGQPARVSYKLVSNGTALIETLGTNEAEQMITVYHPDGASLLMTHYCSVGNQPRMRSKGLEGGRLDFSYVDAANLKSSQDHRMTRLVMSFPGPDREWTSEAGGQEHVGRFEFTRRQ